MKLKTLFLALAVTATGFSQTLPSTTPVSEPLPSRAGQEGKAYLWTAGATLLPLALGYIALDRTSPVVPVTLWIGGTMAGPSAGQFYAGSSLGGAGGILLRSVGGLLMLRGTLQGVDDIMCGSFGNDGNCDEEDGKGAITLGLGFYAAGTLWSLIDTHFAVSRSREADRRSSFGFSPTLAATPGGGLQPGAIASLRF